MTDLALRQESDEEERRRLGDRRETERAHSRSGRGVGRGGKDLRRPFLPQGSERPGHRLERAQFARACRHRLRLRRGGGRSARLRHRPLQAALGHGGADHRAAQARLAARLAADRLARLQGRQSGGDLRDLHLQPVADDRQHGGRRAPGSAGLPERGARAEPLRMEGVQPDPVTRGAAVHDYRHAAVDRRRMAGDRRRRDADRRSRHRLLGLGRVEQPEGRTHHHRHLHHRPGRPRARAGADARRAPRELRPRGRPWIKTDSCASRASA